MKLLTAGKTVYNNNDRCLGVKLPLSSWWSKIETTDWKCYYLNE